MSDRQKWDAKADMDLFVALCDELQPTQEQLRGVLGRVHKQGYTYTLKAVTYFTP